MKRIIKITGIVLAILFIVIQFIPRDRNDGVAKPIDGITKVYPVPKILVQFSKGHVMIAIATIPITPGMHRYSHSGISLTAI